MLILNSLYQPIISSNTSPAHTKQPCKVSFRSAGDIFIKSADSAIHEAAKSDLVKQFVSFFKKSTDELPKGLDMNISETSGQLLSFNTMIKKGKNLKVTKTAIHKNCKNYFYITLKEYKDNELVNAFAIDMDKMDLIKLRKSGSIKLKEEDFIRITPNDSCYSDCYRKLSDYLTAIYDSKGESRINTPEAKESHLKGKRISIDDLLDEDVILETPKAISEQDFYACEQAAAEKAENSVERHTTTIDANSTAQKRTKHPKPIKPVKNNKLQTVEKQKTDFGINNRAIASANVKPILIDNRIAAKYAIGKAPYGMLDSTLEKQLTNIERTLEKIIMILDAHKGNMGKIERLKTNYEPILYLKDRQKTINFKLDDGNMLGVVHTNASRRFSRIIFKDSKEGDTHFLIENRLRVVSNLNKKAPWVVPVRFRYMTDEQIKASNIDKYIGFLNEEVPRYYKYLYENLYS